MPRHARDACASSRDAIKPLFSRLQRRGDARAVEKPYSDTTLLSTALFSLNYVHSCISIKRRITVLWGSCQSCVVFLYRDYSPSMTRQHLAKGARKHNLIFKLII